MSWKNIFLLTLPNFGQDIMRGPAIGLIQFIYATYFGVPLEWIASILLITGLFDAFSDPICGLFSDRYYQRHHTRKPFLAVGMVISVIGMWFLFNPRDPDNIGYYAFLFTYLTWYAGWTILEVPYLAWKAEATSDYQSRTRIAAIDSVMSLIGGLVLVVVAANVSNNQYTPDTLSTMSWIVAVVLPITVIVALWLVPNPQILGKPSQPTLKATWNAITKSKPFLAFIVLFIICTFPAAMNNAVGLFYIVTYLELNELPNEVAKYVVPSGVIGVMAIAVLFSQMSKQLLWSAGMVMVSFAPPLVVIATSSELFSFENNSVGFYLFVMLSVTSTLGITAVSLGARSMLGDVIDYGKWKFGSDNGGVYASTLTLAAKLSITLGGSAALFGLARWFDFDPQNPAFTDHTVFGIELFYAWIPMCLGVLTIPFVMKYPLNKKRQQVVVKVLERQHIRAVAAGLAIDEPEQQLGN